MPSVTIDAGLLAVPPLDADPGDARSYVQTLLDWRILLKEHWVGIYMSEKAAEVLFESDLYPLRPPLRRLFSVKGIQEYDVNTVAQLADTLLQLTPPFEDYFKVRDVFLSDLSTDPDLYSIHTAQPLKSDLARCAVLFAILRTHCAPPILDHALIVKPWKGSNLVNVRALIDSLKHSRSDIEPIPSPPAYYEGPVWVCSDFEELILGLNELDVWNSSTDEVGLMVASQISIFKSRISRGLDPDWNDIPSFHFGGTFLKTAKECCSVNPPKFGIKVLRAIVETIDHLSMANTHPLREGRGGNAPQRMRGEAAAWRRDIDHQYHLHYWESPESQIELASVVVHNDFWIP